MRKFIFTLLVVSLLMPVVSFAQNTADYLILNDIGTFRIAQPKYFFKGEPPIGGPRVNQNDSGILSGIGHFQDHSDTTYKVMHIDNTGAKPSPEVEITQHTGGDSDRWLLHELDASYRNYYGIPGKSYAIVPINGNPILEYGSAGWDYRWISGNKVININYHDSQMTKPEPLEVVQAYLAKNPSTITPITLQQLRSDENVIKWIKDEMDRRLWLCDKWNAQFQGSGVKQTDLMVKLLENMEVFLKYREKYFKIAAEAESNLLDTYQESNNLAAIQTKLTEYKTWWTKHKDKRISL